MGFNGIAWAQQAGNPQMGAEIMFTTVIPLGLLFGVFYFFIIRPQLRKAKEHSRLLASLKRNDEVVTGGGLIGRIAEVGEKIVTVEIAPNVRVRIERQQIAALSSYGRTTSGKKEKGE